MIVIQCSSAYFPIEELPNTRSKEQSELCVGQHKRDYFPPITISKDKGSRKGAAYTKEGALADFAGSLHRAHTWLDGQYRASAQERKDLQNDHITAAFSSTDSKGRRACSDGLTAACSSTDRILEGYSMARRPSGFL